jgi:hypothetical protein
MCDPGSPVRMRWSGIENPVFLRMMKSAAASRVYLIHTLTPEHG